MVALEHHIAIEVFGSAGRVKKERNQTLKALVKFDQVAVYKIITKDTSQWKIIFLGSIINTIIMLVGLMII